MLGRFVKNTEEVKQAVSNIRYLDGDGASNLFLNDGNWEQWISKKQLFLHQTEKSFLLWRDRTEFVHLFFSTAEREELKLCLKTWMKGLTKPVCVDLIAGKDVDRRLLFDCGFSLKRRLRRMCSIQRSVRGGGTNFPATDFAQMVEAEEIMGLLLDAFDSFADQIPDMDELQEDISNRNVVVSRDEQGQIAALEYFARTGQTLWLRFWATKKKYRMRGMYGAIALKKAMDLHGDARRINLWVRADNTPVIKVCESIGFSFDGLEDEVFLYTP